MLCSRAKSQQLQSGSYWSHGIHQICQMGHCPQSFLSFLSFSTATRTISGMTLNWITILRYSHISFHPTKLLSTSWKRITFPTSLFSNTMHCCFYCLTATGNSSLNLPVVLYGLQLKHQRLGEGDCHPFYWCSTNTKTCQWKLLYCTISYRDIHLKGKSQYLLKFSELWPFWIWVIMNLHLPPFHVTMAEKHFSHLST